jgi:hypothetical protein
MNVAGGVFVCITVLAMPASRADSARPPKWRSLWPDGGWISALVIDPQNPETIYAGTRHNGVFKSIDGGTSWMELTGSPTVSLTIDPQDANKVYTACSAGLFQIDLSSEVRSIKTRFGGKK